ncbi:MAG: hypothetical protein NVSMB21_16420 [Vulcanimicrobiaceae bacterium]
MESIGHVPSSPDVVELKRRIAHLISANNGYPEIVERAARLLDCPLSLWDHHGNVIASSRMTRDPIDAASHDFESIWARACGTRDAVRIFLERAAVAAVAIAVADGCGPGKILLFLPSACDDGVETCRAVASDLGFVMVVEGQRQRAVRTTEDRLRASFRHDLLDPAALSGGGLERLADRARGLGYDLAAAYWVIVAEARDLVPGSASLAAARALATRLARGDKRSLTIEQGDRVVVLLSETRLERDRFASVGDAIVSAIRLANGESGALLHAGLSESSVAIGSIAAEVERVGRNLDLNRSLGFRHDLVVQEPIRPYRLLMAVAEPRELLEYWRETIRELYQYDVLNGTELIHTLEIFFACNYNAIEASRRLFVHRNTMTRRLRRIEDTLHVDLGDAETAFRFQLAIRVHHIVISQKLHT